MEVDECVVKYDFSHENCRKPLNEYAQAAKLFITSDKNKNNTKSAFEKGKCGDRSDLMHCICSVMCVRDVLTLVMYAFTFAIPAYLMSLSILLQLVGSFPPTIQTCS